MRTEIVASNLGSLPVYTRAGSPTDLEYSCSMHIHDEVELLRVTKGTFLFSTNERSYTLTSGDIVFVQSHTPHSTRNLEEGTDTQVVQFLFDFFSSDTLSATYIYLSRFINSGIGPIAVFRAGSPEAIELSSYYDAIIQEAKSSKIAHELYVKASIQFIIAFLSRHGVMLDNSLLFDTPTIKRLLPAFEYIDCHYTEHISLADISSVVNLNPSYFCRIFKRITNSTFIEYLNFVRICKIEKPLLTHNASVSEIAINAGFASITYFDKVFKRFKGCTPTEYMKSKYMRNDSSTLSVPL